MNSWIKFPLYTWIPERLLDRSQPAPASSSEPLPSYANEVAPDRLRGHSGRSDRVVLGLRTRRQRLRLVQLATPSKGVQLQTPFLLS